MLNILKITNKVLFVFFLKYGANNERVITGLKRISKPGLRVYAKANEVPRVLNGLRYRNCFYFSRSCVLIKKLVQNKLAEKY